MHVRRTRSQADGPLRWRENELIGIPGTWVKASLGSRLTRAQQTEWVSGWLLCRGIGYTKRLGGMIHCCRAARLSQVAGNLWAPGLCPCTAILLGSMSHGGGIFRVDGFCALRRKSRESSHAIRKRLQSQAQYLPTPATLPYSALATHRRKPVSRHVYYRVAGFRNSFLPKLPVLE